MIGELLSRPTSIPVSLGALTCAAAGDGMMEGEHQPQPSIKEVSARERAKPAKR